MTMTTDGESRDAAPTDGETAAALGWVVRADDGRRDETLRATSCACADLAAVRAAVATAKAALQGIEEARVEVWIVRDCGHAHLSVSWIWEHGERGRWKTFASESLEFFIARVIYDPSPTDAVTVVLSAGTAFHTSSPKEPAN